MTAMSHASAYDIELLGLPELSKDEKYLREFLNAAWWASLGDAGIEQEDVKPEDDPIKECRWDHGQVILRFGTPEAASLALSLNGLRCRGCELRFSRPKGCTTHKASKHPHQVQVADLRATLGFQKEAFAMLQGWQETIFKGSTPVQVLDTWSSMLPASHYDILAVDRSASSDEILAAFRHQCSLNCERGELRKARRILTCAETKVQYDHEPEQFVWDALRAAKNDHFQPACFVLRNLDRLRKGLVRRIQVLPRQSSHLRREKKMIVNRSRGADLCIVSSEPQAKYLPSEVWVAGERVQLSDVEAFVHRAGDEADGLRATPDRTILTVPKPLLDKIPHGADRQNLIESVKSTTGLTLTIVEDRMILAAGHERGPQGQHLLAQAIALLQSQVIWRAAVQFNHGTYQAWGYAMWAEKIGIQVVPNREPDRDEAWEVLATTQQELQLPSQDSFPQMVTVILSALQERADVGKTVIKVLTSKVVAFEVKEANFDMRAKAICLMIRLWARKRLAHTLGDFEQDALFKTLWKLPIMLGNPQMQQLLLISGQVLQALHLAWIEFPDKSSWLPWNMLLPAIGDQIGELLKQAAESEHVQMRSNWRRNASIAAFITEYIAFNQFRACETGIQAVSSRAWRSALKQTTPVPAQSAMPSATAQPSAAAPSPPKREREHTDDEKPQSKVPRTLIEEFERNAQAQVPLSQSRQTTKPKQPEQPVKPKQKAMPTVGQKNAANANTNNKPAGKATETIVVDLDMHEDTTPRKSTITSAPADRAKATSTSPSAKPASLLASTRQFEKWLNGFDEGKGKFADLYLQKLQEQFNDMEEFKECAQELCNWQEQKLQLSHVETEFWTALDIKTMGHKLVWLKQLQLPLHISSSGAWVENMLACWTLVFGCGHGMALAVRMPRWSFLLDAQLDPRRSSWTVLAGYFCHTASALYHRCPDQVLEYLRHRGPDQVLECFLRFLGTRCIAELFATLLCAPDPEHGLFEVDGLILRLVEHLSGDAPPSEDPNENVSLVLKTLISQACAKKLYFASAVVDQMSSPIVVERLVSKACAESAELASMAKAAASVLVGAVSQILHVTPNPALASRGPNLLQPFEEEESHGQETEADGDDSRRAAGIALVQHICQHLPALCDSFLGASKEEDEGPPSAQQHLLDGQRLREAIVLLLEAAESDLCNEDLWNQLLQLATGSKLLEDTLSAHLALRDGSSSESAEVLGKSQLIADLRRARAAHEAETSRLCQTTQRSLKVADGPAAVEAMSLLVELARLQDSEVLQAFVEERVLPRSLRRLFDRSWGAVMLNAVTALCVEILRSPEPKGKEAAVSLLEEGHLLDRVAGVLRRQSEVREALSHRQDHKGELSMPQLAAPLRKICAELREACSRWPEVHMGLFNLDAWTEVILPDLEEFAQLEEEPLGGFDKLVNVGSVAIPGEVEFTPEDLRDIDEDFDTECLLNLAGEQMLQRQAQVAAQKAGGNEVERTHETAPVELPNVPDEEPGPVGNLEPGALPSPVLTARAII
ncbi:unnamed protein product [Symbiodinium microadriaticum]|nr:unnamed protein product [Symbiodinium microadriaticum]